MPKNIGNSNKKAEFENLYRESKLMMPSLGTNLKMIMYERDVRISEASYRTGLSETVITRLRGDKNPTHDMRTMIKLCAGLDFNVSITRILLESCGIALNNATREQFAYKYIIENMSGMCAELKENLLESIGFLPLGIQD